jgi:flagellar biogenesis protein FliO
MTTEALRVSPSTFWLQVFALWERILRLSRRAPRRLRLCESLALGDRRFVAVVEFETARFLLGGTPSSVVLLSRLSDAGALDDGKDKDGEDEDKEDCISPQKANVTGNRRGETC